MSFSECGGLRYSVLRGVVLSAVFGLGVLQPQPAAAQFFDWFGGGSRYENAPVDVEPAPVRRRPNRSTQFDKDANKFGTLTGPLAIVVSIAKQRVTLFADGKPVADAPVSTGTTGHETPMGIFAVIAKSRFHESNIYSGAAMPYMQRITWSGIALHEGPLPGHAASHGCIRLPGSFASSLFKVTRMGARVVITRDAVAPVEFASTRLFVPKKPDPEPPVAAAPPVVVADAQSTASIKTDEQKTDLSGGLGAPAVIAKLDEQPAIAAPQVKPEIKKRKGPVQVFVSRKSGRLYVRQDFQPLFDVPVTIAEPDKPWGTHIFTAMAVKDDSVRWTAMTIPSGYASKADAKDKRDGKKLSAREIERRARLASDLANAPPAHTALERFDMPKEAVDRISELLAQGTSLIVSDNALSVETGLETDFVVETP
ncbi:MAG: L,D-transpeptidase [Pseudolabrys sp.]|nr:L,D-transpeptidase [Pseudolabrys sp.]